MSIVLARRGVIAKRHDSGGGTGGTPSPGLWFEFPDVSSSDKMVFAHYFPPFPVAFTNTAGNDYYENNYLPVNGEGGIHVEYGGFLRDRPLRPGAPWPGATWERDRMAVEISFAQKYHIDGFVCDILGTSGQNWERCLQLFDEASANFPGFYVIPMLDGDGSGASAGYVSAAAAINTLLSKACAYKKQDNTYIVASYRPESQSTSFWSNLKTQLQSVHGKTVEFWHVYLNPSSAASYAPQGATGRWGDGADPGVYNTVSSTWITQARSRGESIFYSVWAQDIRPKSGWFDEALNTGSLRAGWEKAMEHDVEMVQLTTWNDYSEGSHYNPSRMRGEALLALTAWNIAKWKTGSTPQILEDAVFISHRNQMLGATITGGQTQFMVQNASRVGRSTVREHVEILTYLPAPDTITVNIGGNVYNYVASAGEHIQTYPMQPGTVSVTTGRGVNLVSPITIRSSSGNDDRQYVFAYNIAGTAGQLDPTPTS